MPSEIRARTKILPLPENVGNVNKGRRQVQADALEEALDNKPSAHVDASHASAINCIIAAVDGYGRTLRKETI